LNHSNPGQDYTIEVGDHVSTVLTLKEADLRVTAPRVAVLRALEEHPHTTAGELTAHVRRALGSVSMQAVYNVLEAFATAGIARRIEPAGSAALYETRTGDNHHHLICRGCGTVADVDCLASAAPCLTPAVAPGFTVDEAEVVFWGHCATCLTT